MLRETRTKFKLQKHATFKYVCELFFLSQQTQLGKNTRISNNPIFLCFNLKLYLKIYLELSSAKQIFLYLIRFN